MGAQYPWNVGVSWFLEILQNNNPNVRTIVPFLFTFHSAVGHSRYGHNQRAMYDGMKSSRNIETAYQKRPEVAYPAQMRKHTQSIKVHSNNVLLVGIYMRWNQSALSIVDVLESRTDMQIERLVLWVLIKPRVFRPSALDPPYYPLYSSLKLRCRNLFPYWPASETANRSKIQLAFCSEMHADPFFHPTACRSFWDAVD